MIDAQPEHNASSLQTAQREDQMHDEEHLAARCMFLKEYDLLDIDRGHFWHKLTWHGVHVEFPSPQFHYEANPHERQIREYLISLPEDVLEARFTQLQDVPELEFEHGDHHFRLVWDDEVQRHMHCYYQRSRAGREKDRASYQQQLQEHVEGYENDRKFPSKRLSQRLEWLREERARAQQAVDAWDRMIAHIEAQMAQDQLLHVGAKAHA